MSPSSLPRLMVAYIPSQGDLPPPKQAFPPSQAKNPEPLVIGSPLLSPWVLEQSLSMRASWESLRGLTMGKLFFFLHICHP